MVGTIYPFNSKAREIITARQFPPSVIWMSNLLAIYWSSYSLSKYVWLSLQVLTLYKGNSPPTLVPRKLIISKAAQMSLFFFFCDGVPNYYHPTFILPSLLCDPKAQWIIPKHHTAQVAESVLVYVSVFHFILQPCHLYFCVPALKMGLHKLESTL